MFLKNLKNLLREHGNNQNTRNSKGHEQNIELHYIVIIHGVILFVNKFDLRFNLHEILNIGNLEVKFGDQANMDIKLIFPFLSLDTCTCNKMESRRGANNYQKAKNEIKQ
jgi:hypothetical protein